MAKKFEINNVEEFTVARSGRRITNEQARELRRQLKADPADLNTRLILFGRTHCKRSQALSQPHWIWLIQNHPRGSIHRWVNSSMKDNELYREGRRCWLRQLRLNPDDISILFNASQFFMWLDGKLATKLLSEAAELDAANDELSYQLAHLLKLRAMRGSARHSKAFAKQSLDAITEALRRYAVRTDDSSYLLTYFSFVLNDFAELALENRLFEDARFLAQKLLEHESLNRQRRGVVSKRSTQFELSSHYAHAILGKSALAEGDIDGANYHLKTMMKFNVLKFADYSLAFQLSSIGESDLVIDYFKSHLSRWRDLKDGPHLADAPRMQAWLLEQIKEVEC